MANITLPKSKSFFCILTISIFIISSILYPVAGHDGDSANELSIKYRQPKKNQMKQKHSRFIFYWHDILSGGKNATAVRLINPINSSSIYFGGITMIDDPLTQKPDSGSKLLGRAQGFYAGASQTDEVAFLMVMNFYFMTGKYNGSTISIMGRNPMTHAVREMSVIGGTGLFRFARGYAQARTLSTNPLFRKGMALDSDRAKQTSVKQYECLFCFH